VRHRTDEADGKSIAPYGQTAPMDALPKDLRTHNHTLREIEGLRYEEIGPRDELNDRERASRHI